MPAVSTRSAPAAATGWRDLAIAAGLFAFLFALYNLNGREIGSYDTQSTKFAARELIVRGTFSLDHVIAETPQYATRWGFILAPDGHYRSVYSPAAAVAGAALCWPLWRAHLIDLGAPFGANLIAKLTASMLVALAVVLAYFTARHRLTRRHALVAALALGCGTGYWSTASQTLWQTETVLCGLALALLAFDRDPADGGIADAVLIGVGLGIAGTARSQLAPLIAVILVGTWWRSGWRHGLLAGGIVAMFAGALCAANLRWFGNALGALPSLRGVNAQIHGTTWASFNFSREGFAGLLLSPSRGILIFSPVVLVAVAGIAAAADWRSSLRWCAAAAGVQYGLYGAYSVWWGGHTYGPRYLVDILPLAIPLAAAAMAAPPRIPAVRLITSVALAWSILVAATGAWCYPNDAWNSDPVDVDTHHERLWLWGDNQIARCWRRGLSPQNFDFFH